MSRRAGMVVRIGALITGAPRAALADRGAGERDRETAARALRAYATRYVFAAAHLGSGAAGLRHALRVRRRSPHANLRPPDRPGVQRVPYAFPGADRHRTGVQAQRLRVPEKRVPRGQEPRGPTEPAAQPGGAGVLDVPDIVHQHEEGA